MSTKSSKIQIQHHGGPSVMEWVDVEVAAPAANEVQIEQKAVGLNFIDIYFRTGLYDHPLPHGLGFEASGIVTAVGSEVSHLKVGDRVAYGQSPIGAYALLRNMPAFQVVKLPEQISFEEGAAIMLKGLTAWYLLRQTYRVQAGETILFHAAAGGVGLIATQWAKALGVKVIGTASSAEKIALAKAHGAWEMINYRQEDVAARVLELTQGDKLPVVYDGVGKDTFETSLNCLKPRGLLVSFGNASGAVTGVNLGILASKGSLYVTRPTVGAYVNTRELMQQAADELFEQVLAGNIKVRIDQRVPLVDVAKAHEDLAAGRTTGSTVLTID
ncbi:MULTISPECIES: quinone oxidoreductase family protein [Oligella]|uniref:Quinone oxidoreductase n=2 Tax=Oligella urethralis TaxID=90245 RepID=A0A096BDE4_9BURK|nr:MULTISPECIES: quinone oxidoreductase [Oligella]AVL70563.1 quinone oxidoreductase [Oligella urethralis]KGF31184.1 quinone oxidoreductase [Oligella urethralis DNF00040]OFV46718.1 quinone oxidoreductase [Oligella sp. HMSC09E12]WOS37177.1 Quinone oxidoreductase 1 [Oligella urethralis]SPY07997.1 Quinone oxidoreductase 1 [Oligella urethralis]